MTAAPMMTVSPAPYRLSIREAVGLAHEPQVIEVPLPAGTPVLREEHGGALHPAQPSSRRPGHGFLRVALEPGQALSFVPAEKTVEVPDPVTVSESAEAWRVGNGRFELELLAGEKALGPEAAGSPLSGPVLRMRIGAGPWRGRTFLDTARPARGWKAEWRERGPLRAVYRCRIDLAGDGFYEVVLTVDAGADFARVEETFSAGAADQIVWDFAGADLPERLGLLDSTAGQAAKEVHYHFDQRHARLWCWTQYSQLHDLSDGFALHFAGADDIVGAVALEGGSWQGNALNHLEAWTRRWETADPATRRLPADAKADSFPGPERIPARGGSVCAPHFTLEGWLRRGARTFALVLSTGRAIAPRAGSPGTEGVQGCSPALGHFEEVPDRARYRAQQGRLRQIQIRHGLLPLQAQLAMAFAWPLEPAFQPGAPSTPGRDHALRVAQEHLALPAPAADPDRIGQLDLFLQARVFGFWEGSGAAYSNCVVGRRIGPEMLRAEELARQGKLDAATLARWRAWFAFLAYLNASPHLYPGAATMEPLGSPGAVEPTLAGMANQNFYTDIIALAGFAGEAFPGHPAAAAWRALFADQWRRQLAYHVYPESGLWEESHTYFQHVLATVLPLLLRARERGEGDPFADPALQRLAGSAPLQLTPRDAVFGGFRHPVSFGDHGVEVKTYRGLYAEFARAFALHAPELAGRLAWAAAEMGVEGEAGAAPLPPPSPLPWGHGPVQGLGFFFRGADAEGRENLLALRSGMAWGHHHNDEGSLQLFAHGRSMIVDSAFSQPQERGEKKVAASGHSQLVAEGIEPLHYLWRFHRGWVLRARAEGPLAHAVAGVPVYSTWPRGLEPQLLRRAAWGLRAVVELAPALYLVADYPDRPSARRVRFHVAHDEVAVEGAEVRCRFDGTCHLRIVPLASASAPTLSLDRPVSGTTRQATTAVEYAVPAEPWSLFLVGAFPGADSTLAVSGEPSRLRIEQGGRVFLVAREGRGQDLEPLRISEEGSGAEVVLDPGPLRSALRET